MIDHRRIVQRCSESAGGALATLVRVEGSSYRRPGAHLLIAADGRYTGSISGGCLEAEVVRKAEWMVRDGATVQRYSTMFDDTAEIPFGLGCGGVVDLLIEPGDTAECRAYVEAMRISLHGRETLVATWLPRLGRPLARAVFGADKKLIFASEGLSDAQIAAVDAAQGVRTYFDELSDVYCERLSAPQRLVVLGGGDDAKPVVAMAALLGWSVIVADARPSLARAERFPEAEQVVVCGSVNELEMRGGDAVVLMTHSYEQDRSFLIGLLSSERFGLSPRTAFDPRPGYIGLLGARHRSSLLVAEAAAALGQSVAECCERVWAPVGLDLGGDGPEAIALAVVAEIQAWVQGKLGHSRRLTADEVMEQIGRGDSSRYHLPQCAISAAKSR